MRLAFESAADNDRPSASPSPRSVFSVRGCSPRPRVYYAMANDNCSSAAVARVNPKTRVPIVAIALQGIVAIIIALSGTYEQILGYVVSTDFLFFGLTGLAIFRFRGHKAAHPIGTVIFVVACWLVVAGTVVAAPRNSANRLRDSDRRSAGVLVLAKTANSRVILRREDAEGPVS